MPKKVPVPLGYALVATFLAIVLRLFHAEITSMVLPSLREMATTMPRYRPEGNLSPGERPAMPPSARILSYDPFVMHITDFISLDERQYLKNLSSPLLKRSLVQHSGVVESISEERTSSTAYLPWSDPVVQSIFRRASEFQGYSPLEQMDMQVTSYQQGQQYIPHTDWFNDPDRKYNRISTFFATIEADCVNCGTQFPHIKVDWSKKDPRWCELVDCQSKVLTTRNVVGGAWFWRNLYPNGEGRHDTQHAGLPATNGTKIGLNIWTDVEMSHFWSNFEAGFMLP